MKTKKIIIILLTLLMAIPFFSLNVVATESVIHDNAYSLRYYGNTIYRAFNGSLMSIPFDRASNRIDISESYDDGATWVETLEITDTIPYKSYTITGDDSHSWVFYVHHDEPAYILRYRENTGAGWGGVNAVCTLENTLGGIYGIDTVTYDDTLYLSVAYKDSLGKYNVQFMFWNWILDTWSTPVYIVQDVDTAWQYTSMGVYGNDVYSFHSNNSNIVYGKYNINTGVMTNHTLTDTSYHYEHPDFLDVSGGFYVFYSGNTSTSNDKYAILYKYFDGSNFGSQHTVCEDTSYSQYAPVSNRNNNGDINLVWHGKSVISTAFNQLRTSVYSGGSWSNVAFISSGASEKQYPKMVYQQNIVQTKLSEGVSIVYIDDTNDDMEYIDSGSLIWYEIGEGAEYEGSFEFNANSNIGNLDTGCIAGLGYKDVEFKYQIATTINATGFDLLVGQQMHTYDSDLSNYDLYINGNALGNPDEWKQYSDKYVLRWIFDSDLEIVNSEILFEVWHDQLISGTTYWNIGVSCGYNDLDGDGIATLRYSNTYPNGAFDGTWLSKDVAYQLYYNVIQFVEDDVDVTYNSISATNTTYYVGESVSLTYTLKSSEMVYDNYVRIWNDDTSTEITLGTMQGFPYLCTHQVETIGFVPFTSANYTAHLYINGADTCNVSFFVDEQINANMSVFTYPNPSTSGQKIWVYYNYDHPTGKDGAIFLCNSPNLNTYESVNYLSDGDSGFWTTTFNSVGIYYFIMAVDTNGNGTYGIVNNGVHAHYVRSEYGDNYFTLGGYNIRLNEDGRITQFVNGECNMVSGNCYIYDNNELVKTITESPFSYSYDVHTSGLHTVEMRLITNTTIVLYTQNYTITSFTGVEDIEQVEDTGYAIRDWIYTNYGDIGIFLTGVLIILGFMLIPFALVLYANVKFNKNVSLGDIHWSIYLIFAIVGVAVTVILHIADLWLILLIVVACITIAVVIFKGNKQ